MAEPAASFIGELGLARRADEAVVVPPDLVRLQSDCAPLGKAWLADVVGSVIDAWLSGPDRVVRRFTAQRDSAASELDQRVFGALIDGCLEFQIFLLQLGQIRLELQKSGVVSEQSVLRLEQLVQKRGGSLLDEGFVANRAQALGDVARDSD